MRAKKRPPGSALWMMVVMVVGALAGCGEGDPTPAGPDGPPVDLATEVVTGELESPVHLTAPQGDPRMFVVELPGRIRVIEDGALLERPFLDISDRVSTDGEQGLFSVAFHPDYASNGFFYVDYTDPDGDTRIERYTVGSDRNAADPGSARLLLGVEQPFSNHNGGQVAFGPDGMLYVGMGDGGGAGDPRGHGQDPGTLLGALLRLDVDGGDPFAVPEDNPFVGDPAGRDEIWATGLRNPWRFAFDEAEGLLYVADVGQERFEEVSVVPVSEPGLDFGWNVMEGNACFPNDPCDTEGRVTPVLTYDHSAEACSITGGFVYRGRAIPELQGHYFYSDLCAGFLRSFRLSGGEVAEEREWDVGGLGSVLSFGRDSDGELYVLSADGTVRRIVEGG